MLYFFMCGVVKGCAQEMKCGVNNMCQILDKLRGKSANDILEEYGTKDKYPVDIVGIAHKIGITIGSLDFSDLEKKSENKETIQEKGYILGATVVDEERIIIAYRKDLIPEENKDHLVLSDIDKRDRLVRRQRYTIARQIAFCCKYMDEGAMSLNVEYQSDVEGKEISEENVVANIFAGELLIPTVLLTPILSVLGKAYSVAYLANLFKVPKKAMKARLDYLVEQGDIPNYSYYL